MRILLYGAGVIGTLYGAQLARAGNEVVVLARGKRLLDIARGGLVIHDVVTEARQKLTVRTIDALAPDDAYDLVIVPVRRDHLDGVLVSLEKSRATPRFIFCANNAPGADKAIKRLGRERVLLGFPGAGGQLVGETVHYLMIREQHTTIGEVNGRRTERLKAIASCFEAAQFPISISADMQSWLKTHAAFVTSVSAAVYAQGGDANAVASNEAVLHLMVRAIAEAFRALRQAGFCEVPWNLRILHEIMPEWFAVRYWRKAFLGPLGQFSLAAHSNAARDEMEMLASDVWRLVHSDSRSQSVPSFDRLLRQAAFVCATAAT